ncbi:MAG: c-type cytochrome [Betaproteobacteria bacterium]
MKVIYPAMVALGVVLTAPAQADEALARSRNCFACHSIEKKVVGPAYKEVAAKYKNDPQALARLAAKIKAGGKDVWGNTPMPPNPVTEAEAKKLAAWVLSLK